VGIEVYIRDTVTYMQSKYKGNWPKHVRASWSFSFLVYFLLFANCALKVEKEAPEMLVHKPDDRNLPFVSFVIFTLSF
jgi:hypothetical protein